MKQIGESIPSRQSTVSGGKSSVAKRGPRQPKLPEVVNRLTDVSIPRLVWSSWKPANGPRQLRRELTAEERTALQQRANELAFWVTGYEELERDQVALAVVDMFGAFRSVRHGGEDAVLLIDSTCRLLRDFPAWAIVKACDSIQRNGVWRNGAFDRQWPPSDPEIIAEVRDKLRLYGDQYRSAVDLLQAEVET